jgi:hypothetical protein
MLLSESVKVGLWLLGIFLLYKVACFIVWLLDDVATVDLVKRLINDEAERREKVLYKVNTLEQELNILKNRVIVSQVTGTKTIRRKK